MYRSILSKGTCFVLTIITFGAITPTHDALGESIKYRITFDSVSGATSYRVCAGVTVGNCTIKRDVITPVTTFTSAELGSNRVLAVWVMAIKDGQLSLPSSIQYLNRFTLYRGFNMVGNWLNNPNGSVISNIFPLGKPIADGTTVYKYDPLHGYSLFVYDSAFDGWDPAAPVLNPGEGAIIDNNASAAVEVAFTGSYSFRPLNTPPVGRWGMFATNVPNPASVSALGLAASNGDTIYGIDAQQQKWIQSMFETTLGGWDPFQDTIYPGESRFMFNN